MIGQMTRQVRYTNKAFWRNSAAAVFTFAFPVIFIVLLAAVFGGGKVRTASGVVVATSAFYVPAICVFAVVSACFTNIAMTVTIQRDSGVLKRVRGTPLSPGAYLGARVVHSILISALLVTICTALGVAFYDVGLPSLPAVVVTLIVGAACFCSLGLAITAAIPDAHAASPMVNAIILPILLISDVFVPPGHLPDWLNTISMVFPVRHFSDAMQIAFFPSGSAFSWPDLAILAAWGIGGLLLALRFFSWEPRR
jgi:ABC-2 type transport system permease protein